MGGVLFEDFGEDDRAADRAGVAIKGGRVGSAGCVEVGVGGPVGLAGFAVERAVEGAGAAFEYGIEDAAAGAGDLGVVGVDLQFHLLRGFDGGDDDGAVVEIGDGYAVDEVVVGADGAAGDRDGAGAGLVLKAVEARVAGGGDVGAELGEEIGIAAEVGEIFELLGIDVLAVGGGGAVEERRGGLNLDGFGGGADRELNVDGFKLLGGDDEIFLFIAGEAGLHDAEGVSSGLNGGEDVFAVAVGFGDAGDFCGLVGELHGDVWKRGAFGVGQQAADTALIRLRAGGEAGQGGEQDGCGAEQGEVVKQGPGVLLVHRCDPPEGLGGGDGQRCWDSKGRRTAAALRGRARRESGSKNGDSRWPSRPACFASAVRRGAAGDKGAFALPTFSSEAHGTA